MDALQFAYWLNGFAELHQEPPTAEQWRSIKEHLGLVFTKVTPPVHVPSPNIPYDWQTPRTADPLPWRPTVTCSAMQKVGAGDGDTYVIC